MQAANATAKLAWEKLGIAVFCAARRPLRRSLNLGSGLSLGTAEEPGN